VQLDVSGPRARDIIWGHRGDTAVKDESKRILQKHTRRNSPIQGRARKSIKKV
jgi:hypothetical protein